MNCPPGPPGAQFTDDGAVRVVTASPIGAVVDDDEDGGGGGGVGVGVGDGGGGTGTGVGVGDGGGFSPGRDVVADVKVVVPGSVVVVELPLPLVVLAEVSLDDEVEWAAC